MGKTLLLSHLHVLHVHSTCISHRRESQAVVSIMSALKPFKKPKRIRKPAAKSGQPVSASSGGVLFTCIKDALGLKY